MAKEIRLSAEERAAMDRAIVAAADALRDLRKRFGRHLLADEHKGVGKAIKNLELMRYRIHGGGAK